MGPCLIALESGEYEDGLKASLKLKAAMRFPQRKTTRRNPKNRREVILQ